MVKNPPANAGDGGDPGLERCPGEGNDNPLQYSCLENPMVRGAWQAIVHGVSKSQTRLNTHKLQSLKSYWIVNRTFAKHAWGLWAKSHKSKMCHHEPILLCFCSSYLFFNDLNQLVLLLRKMKLLSMQRSKEKSHICSCFFSEFLG